MCSALCSGCDVVYFGGGLGAVWALYLAGVVVAGEDSGFCSADGVWSVGPSAHGWGLLVGCGGLGVVCLRLCLCVLVLVCVYMSVT